VDNRADGVREARSLFQERGSGAVPTSALQLLIDRIDFKTAKQLNKLWHSRLPFFGAPFDAFCYVAEFDGLYYASAIWTHPVSRSLPQVEWLELRRLAIAPDAPKNTASRMLGVMTRLIRKSRPEVTRLVSYQDCEVHTGGIYKAAGWTATAESEFRTWAHEKRGGFRNPDQSTAPKQRWELAIR
jgi:hypothetical protein